MSWGIFLASTDDKLVDTGDGMGPDRRRLVADERQELNKSMSESEILNEG